ncbi:MAG: hypothetical protein WCX95_04385 [Candidatus Gracilibacteria bacterium]
MSTNILLVVLILSQFIYSGYEKPNETIQNANIKQEIIEKYGTENLILQFKEQTNEDKWTNTELNGNYITKAEVQIDNFNQPYVFVTFTDEGSKLFAKITERNIGKPLGIFINGNLISAPTVNEKITGGSAQIAGNFTIQEAKTLVETLNQTIKSKK